MDTQSADAVWSRIEARVREEPGGAIATDGDGTLWSGDVGDDLFHAFLEHGRVEPSSLEALRRAAADHALSDAGTGPAVARRIYDAYLGHAFPEEIMCELMVWCFAGWRRDEVAAFAAQVIERVNLSGRLHKEVFVLLDRARAAGIPVFLVSASPIAVVLAAGARVGFDAHHVVAACPRFVDDVMQPDIDRPMPYGPGKVSRLRERTSAGGAASVFYAAFGDNSFDVPMLASSRVPVAVRPKPRLRDRAALVAGLVELERIA